LTRKEKSELKQGTFSHRLDLERPGEALAGEEGEPDKETASVVYRLPEEWPLPYRTGESASLLEGTVNHSFASSLLASVDDGQRPVLMYDGPLLPVLLGQTCISRFGDLDMEQLHLTCPGQEDQCGAAGPDLLVLRTDSDDAVGVVTGEQGSCKLSGRPFILSVGSAYSFSYSSFDFDQCEEFAPTWSSFVLFPRDSCPIAMISSAAPPIVELERASSSLQVVVDHLGSFSPDGTPLKSLPEWSLAQPYPGLARLAPFKNEESPFRKADLRTVGKHTIGLDVTDEKGRAACVTDIEEIEVRSSVTTDLRVELVWYTLEGNLEHPVELDLLVMHPSQAKILDQVNWAPDKFASEHWCSGSKGQPDKWPILSGESKEECEAQEGDMQGSQPEVVTVNNLNAVFKENRYPIAVLYLEDEEKNPDNLPVLAMLSVYVRGEQKYLQGAELTPGYPWIVGHVGVEFMEFDGAGP